ncbi:hypothetical protein PSH58_18150 [Pseudomonas hefeiensis]|uniref:Uncharacterized protein n=1 Tax=Pseudomonas hefeiensis TaxID=2738125 RepID=A0ABY9G5A2_9PSED|nr:MULTISPECIES: hypothetical protein [unclassified Pseudomonas]WLH10799.1 hypothetical protein PSH57_18120 [Pseudomonas sp. FP205]WLH93880.1 hypothetical protein PSH58_18150 [Pseudomonas sp. FP53]WLI38155.1 hypothetical protein PSH74_18080 [Pseudomonas sp. FP821]
MSWESVSFWIEHHPGLASWVQAFGSIAAILAAIWIASRDSRMRRNAEAEIRENAVVRAEAVVSEAALRVRLAIDVHKGITPNQMDLISTGLSQSLQHLTEVISSDGVNSAIHTQLFLTRVAVEDVALFVRAISSEKNWSENTRLSVEKRLNGIESAQAALVVMQ